MAAFAGLGGPAVAAAYPDYRVVVAICFVVARFAEQHAVVVAEPHYAAAFAGFHAAVGLPFAAVAGFRVVAMDLTVVADFRAAADLPFVAAMEHCVGLCLVYPKD